MTVRVFEQWQDQPLEQVIQLCRELVEDTDLPTVQRWRESGGKVVGHFQVYFPEEIAHAAGMLPLKIRGAPVESKYADSRFGSYLCSIIKTSLDLALRGVADLDLFVTHPICDAARNLAAVWGRNFSYPCQILYLPQNANSPQAANYLRNEYARLKKQIEMIAGREISTDDLQRSMKVFNQNRALLHELYAIKREKPWKLSVYEAYLLVAVGGFIPREEHNELLSYVIPQINSRSARRQDKIRLVFEGGFCEQPPLDLIQTVSQFCYVVDDDLMIGLRWILEEIPIDGDPLFRLAEAYLNNSSYSPVQHDHNKPKEKMLLKRVENSRADAVIISAAKMCEPGLEEIVTYSESLDEAGIPYFVSEFEENMTSFDQIEIQLETFVENLLFA